MKEGLSFDKFASSQSESIAVVKAYMECLRFVLFNFSVNEAVGEAQSEGRDEDENEAFVSHFIQEEVCNFASVISESMQSRFLMQLIIHIRQSV